MSAKTMMLADIRPMQSWVVDCLLECWKWRVSAVWRPLFLFLFVNMIVKDVIFGRKKNHKTKRVYCIFCGDDMRVYLCCMSIIPFSKLCKAYLPYSIYACLWGNNKFIWIDVDPVLSYLHYTQLQQVDEPMDFHSLMLALNFTSD